MANNALKHLVSTFSLILSCSSAQAAFNFDYFGQEPPGHTKKPFTPRIPGLETGVLTSLIFTPDGKACYFTLKTEKTSQIYVRREQGGNWSQPLPVNFPDGGNWIHGFSPDGNRLYFSARKHERFHRRSVYVRTRTADGWSTAQYLPAPININESVIGIAVSAQEDLYFCSWRKPGKGQCDLWWAKNTDGFFPTTTNLTHLNTKTSECSVMLAPQDRCLVFYSWRSGGQGKADLYVCLPTDNGQWSHPRNMGPRVNTPEGETPLAFSPDGRYMFFYHAGKPHWIETQAVIPEILSDTRIEHPLSNRD